MSAAETTDGGLKGYAAQAGLGVIASPELPGLTPLLCRGDRRVTHSAARGELAEGLEGDLAHYTYIVHDSDGPDDPHHFTVVLTAVPESIGFIPRLICRPHGVSGVDAGFSMGLDDHEDSMRSDRGVELESEAFDDRYSIRVDSEVGDNWVRQLFGPAFINWLTHDAPEDLGFELNDGALCVYMPERLTGTQPLDRLWHSAAQIAQRIRREALEEEGRREAGTAAMPDRPGGSLAAAVERGMREVDWPSPPADAATAIKAYRWVGIRALRPWLWGIGVLLGGLLVGGTLVLAGDGNPLILITTPFVAGSIFWKIAGDRAKAFGKAAFATGYARSRGLTPENPRLFQARHMRLKLPGVVETAMSGPLPGGAEEGTILFLASKSGTSRTDYDAVAAELPAGVEAAPSEDGLQTVQHGSTVVFYATSSGNAKRSAAEVDSLAERAGKVIDRLRG